MAETRHPGRGGAAWKRVRAQILAGQPPCWLCGQPIDYEAEPRTRWSPSVDHILPLKAMRQLDAATQRALALDPANLRPAHYGHNSSRGAKKPTTARRTSRKW